MKSSAQKQLAQTLGKSINKHAKAPWFKVFFVPANGHGSPGSGRRPLLRRTSPCHSRPRSRPRSWSCSLKAQLSSEGPSHRSPCLPLFQRTPD